VDTPESVAEAILERGDALGLLLDFDGTLADIVHEPAKAQMRPGSRQALELLLSAGVRVAVVSGRSMSDIASRVGLDGAWVVGSHGAEMIDPRGAHVRLVEDQRARRALDDFVEHAVALARPLAALVEDKGLSIAVHVRGIGEPAKSRLLGTLRTRVPRGQVPIEIVEGIEVFEVRARGVDKGLAARSLLAQWGRLQVVAIGDDTTDEDLFREALSCGGVSVKVGPRPSMAKRRLADAAGVERLLQLLRER